MITTPAPLVLVDGRVIDFGRARVMGVLNVTPDSFSDGGRFADPARATARGLELAAAGADLLDVGGESTRPGSDPVPAADQIARVVPVIAALARAGAPPISIDTTSAEVAAAALDAGASLVNDISAGRFDPAMLPLVAARRVPVVLMHTSAAPRTMQAHADYQDVVAEVRAHLAARVEAAVAAGVPRERVVLDPGIGFGKRLDHNLALIRGIPALAALGRPVLVGTSRKSFLGKLTGRDVGDRLMATAGSVAASIVLGAHLVRVHDVGELVDAIRVADAIVRG
ncbi:MAG: dihydropteroate synthase [Deltaproteobacteria bacterium]|nr:dihydropteroate synthase [Deltaproteobacteria bacterium]